jgi:hypothetical protein
MALVPVSGTAFYNPSSHIGRRCICGETEIITLRFHAPEIGKSTKPRGKNPNDRHHPSAASAIPYAAMSGMRMRNDENTQFTGRAARVLYQCGPGMDGGQ